jgi:hypothetical protein
MENHEAKVLWESKGKTPAGDPFFSVKEARGYYVYGQRGGTNSIAFVLKDGDKYGLIYESKPPLDEEYNEKHMEITAFGGSIDMDKSYKEICQTEVLEESGYDVSMDRISDVGKTLVSTQMNQLCYGYLVDVSGLEAGETESDIYNAEQEAKDSDEFKHNKVIWFSFDELMDNNDWKSIWIVTKYRWLKNG